MRRGLPHPSRARRAPRGLNHGMRLIVACRRSGPAHVAPSHVAGALASHTQPASGVHGVETLTGITQPPPSTDSIPASSGRSPTSKGNRGSRVCRNAPGARAAPGTPGRSGVFTPTDHRVPPCRTRRDHHESGTPPPAAHESRLPRRTSGHTDMGVRSVRDSASGPTRLARNHWRELPSRQARRSPSGRRFAPTACLRGSGRQSTCGTV